MSTNDLSPDFRETPWWWEAAAPTAEEKIPLPARCDALVIGAGYTGLSAARELAGAGLSVAVIDAEAIGHGASTRNGGSAVAAIKKHFLKKGGGNEAWGSALMSEMRAAYDHFEEVLREERIDAYTGRVGRLAGAHSPRAFDALVAEAEELGAYFDGGTEVVPPERMREELATSYYHGGVITHQAGGAHPALYHRGLVDACFRRGVTFHPMTRALSWSGRRGAFRISTSRGEVKAGEVILATNGYTDAVSSWHRRRIVPIESHMIATEPMGRARVEALMPRMRVYGDTKRVPFYFRPSPDGERLLFGGRASFGRITPREAARVLVGFARQVFPDLGEIRISHAWKGSVGFTFDFVPHIGIHDGIHYAMGCNGAGLVPLSWLGSRLGAQILQPDAAVSVFAGAEFPTRPGYTGKPWFLPIVGRIYQIRDRLDRARA